MEMLKELDTIISNLLLNLGAFAPILASLLILVESILPVLPLAVFITINFYYFGVLPGFLISWVLTCVGCFISFKLCRTKLKKHFDSMLDKKEHKKLKKFMQVLNGLKAEQIAIVVAIPFTPAFLVNIAAGLSNMDQKKFMTSIIIGKIFLVYFWGFIGTSLLESLKNPSILIKVGIMMVLAFILSKLVNKKFRLE